MKNKIFSGLMMIMLVVGAWVAVPTKTNAAGLDGLSGLGNLFILDALFNTGNDKRTSLGDLFILDQLFPQVSTPVAVTTPAPVAAAPVSVATRMAGRIVIQTQENGEAWYVHPQDRQRYYLNGPGAAFSLMSNQSVGVSEADITAFGGVGGQAPSNLAGKFIIRPEANGEIHYVSPVDRSISEVIQGPNGAIEIIEDEGLGITNADLNRIPVSPGSAPIN